jgi:hypothetical protein
MFRDWCERSQLYSLTQVSTAAWVAKMLPKGVA